MKDILSILAVPRCLIEEFFDDHINHKSSMRTVTKKYRSKKIYTQKKQSLIIQETEERVYG